MLYLVSYDVSTDTPKGRARLRHVAKMCENHGIRVQNSVFECTMDYSSFLNFRHKLVKLVHPKEDSLRIYPLGENCRSKIFHFGLQKAFDVEAPLVL